MVIKKILYKKITHYDEDYYWSKRAIVIDPVLKKPQILKYYWLYKLKKMETYNGASLGTYVGHGAFFGGKPWLPHNLRGIHISDQAVIGKNCTIYHQVTVGIAEAGGKAPVIGDNCILGAGCKIIGDIRIGNNVKIGANCVVHFDVPDNATVVCEKARIILK